MRKIVEKVTRFMLLSFCMCFLFGCSSNQNDNSIDNAVDVVDEAELSKQKGTGNESNNFANTVDAEKIEKTINEIDLTEYFQDIDGCAVIYDENVGEYLIHNLELSEKRISPYSTFKIISALIGLQSTVLKDENTVISWNGTRYSFDEWNQDLTLRQAFQTSCIWYFKKVIEQSGKELAQQTLSNLSYGNCDISQWEGSNINNGYTELNGFWLESSLLISPIEQVDTMVKLFSIKEKAYETVLPVLKNIMLVSDNNTDIKIYGKTGSGLKKAWFVGFSEKSDNRYYYAVLLDDPNDNISGQKAKEILLKILENYLP